MPPPPRPCQAPQKPRLDVRDLTKLLVIERSLPSAGISTDTAAAGELDSERFLTAGGSLAPLTPWFAP